MTIFKKNIKCPLKIACYVGNNYEWYCFETIKKVAKILTNYEFYEIKNHYYAYELGKRIGLFCT